MAEKQSLAFITGGHALGVVDKNRDVDLVVPMSEETAKQLADHFGYEDTEQGFKSIRIGGLNLILAYTPEIYQAWKEVTDESIERVSRFQRQVGEL